MFAVVRIDATGQTVIAAGYSTRRGAEVVARSRWEDASLLVSALFGAAGFTHSSVSG
jgi:hypothetical protein